MAETERSLARVDASDLLRLAVLAAEAETALFARHPSGAGRYAGRLLCRALCQGAALHYLDGRTGVKDFDVWSFYAALADGPFPYRWRGTADFGPSKFGRWPSDPPLYTGRRVDFLGRSLPAPVGADPAAVLRDYLSAARTASAKALAAKAVILLTPEHRGGERVWPHPSELYGKPVPCALGDGPENRLIWTDGSPWRFLAAALRRGSFWAGTREAGIALPGVPTVRVRRSPVRTGRAGGTICRRFRLGFLLSCASGGLR
jgi:hypothetical protein